MRPASFLGVTLSVFMAGAAAAQTSVKIGTLGDRSGVYSDIGGEGSVVAARMAVEDFKPNERGLRVEIISADHQNKPDIGSALARQWYDRDGVDAIFDVPTSSVALAVSQVTKEKNKTFVDTGAGTADLTGSQVHTQHRSLGPMTPWPSPTALAAPWSSVAEHVVFHHRPYVFGHTLQRDTTAVVEKNGGKVIGSVKAPFPTADFSSFLLFRAQGSGPR